jgi:hypothetical protein
MSNVKVEVFTDFDGTLSVHGKLKERGGFIRPIKKLM